MQEDSTFLVEATAAGQRRFLQDQQRGKTLTPEHLLRSAHDFAALALHQERDSHPDTAHRRAKPRATAFAEGYTSLLLATPASPAPSPAPTHHNHQERSRRKHQPSARRRRMHRS